MACQVNAPILEEVYTNWGEGSAGLVMLGLSPIDNNLEVNQFKNEFGVTNPCAGIEGNSEQAIEIITEDHNLLGYPTYCVVCPDRTLHFNVCFPADTSCFNNFINSCGTYSVSEIAPEHPGIQVFPNPVSNMVNVRIAYSENIRIELYNTLGAKAKTFNETSGTNLISFSVAHLPRGIYFLKIGSDSKSLTRKISIQ